MSIIISIKSLFLFNLMPFIQQMSPMITYNTAIAVHVNSSHFLQFAEQRNCCVTEKS